MSGKLVAVVSRDAAIRGAAAAAFDRAPAEWRVELCREAPPSADVVVYGPDARGEGVRFDPARPAAVVADVERALGRRVPVMVAVTSPSGGTGATSVALHIAQALVPGGTTCLVELARGGAAERLGFDAAKARTWGELDAGVAELRSCALPTPGGFRVLLAPLEEPAPGPSHGELVERAAGAFERVVLDAPVGPPLQAALEHAPTGVLVVAPTPVGALRARRLLEAFPNASWAIVTNRLGPGGETTRAALERIIGRGVALELPCAPALRDAEDDARLLTSGLYRWRRAVHRLARALGP